MGASRIHNSDVDAEQSIVTLVSVGLQVQVEHLMHQLSDLDARVVKMQTKAEESNPDRQVQLPPVAFHL